MKNLRLKISLAAIILTLPAVSNLDAQSLHGMSLNGSTGLYSIPSGRIGWEQSADFGLDLGYHTILKGKNSHIPAVAMSLFKWVELSGAFDIKPYKDGTDLILGIKLQLPLSTTAIALGGNFQSLSLGGNSSAQAYSAGQLYIATTYSGRFFNMPAETSVVFGTTFMEGSSDSNIDFGMGFDLLLLPDIFNRFIHLVVDFANFSYSVHPFGADHWYRGVLNTGIRIDLSTIKPLSKYKAEIDVVVVDAFDSNRAFAAGFVFGIPF
ncbi:MAG: hypothetical protein LBH43_11320 [Treponema sp.]|jgi:hypothetical protein|nr:hypothetical protein [Treponema sp.]